MDGPIFVLNIVTFLRIRFNQLIRPSNLCGTQRFALTLKAPKYVYIHYGDNTGVGFNRRTLLL